MSEVPVRDLRNNSASVLARVARGETLTVTKDGQPVASITPLRRRSLRVEELIARRAQLPPVDPVALRADIDEILDSAL